MKFQLAPLYLGPVFTEQCKLGMNCVTKPDSLVGLQCPGKVYIVLWWKNKIKEKTKTKKKTKPGQDDSFPYSYQNKVALTTFLGIFYYIS